MRYAMNQIRSVRSPTSRRNLSISTFSCDRQEYANILLNEVVLSTITSVSWTGGERRRRYMYWN